MLAIPRELAVDLPRARPELHLEGDATLTEEVHAIAIGEPPLTLMRDAAGEEGLFDLALNLDLRGQVISAA
jgi:hypothetical protein